MVEIDASDRARIDRDCDKGKATPENARRHRFHTASADNCHTQTPIFFNGGLELKNALQQLELELL